MKAALNLSVLFGLVTLPIALIMLIWYKDVQIIDNIKNYILSDIIAILGITLLYRIIYAKDFEKP